MNVTEKIAELLTGRQVWRGGWSVDIEPDDAGYLAEAVVAAIRAMTPTEQAELIGGDVQDPFGKSSDWDTYARVVGPWRQVTPTEQTEQALAELAPADGYKPEDF